MRRFLFSFCLLMASFSVYAQKSYINVAAVDLWDEYGVGQYITLSGDIPSDMKKYYGQRDRISIGDLLNMLSAKGFEVEFMSSLNSGTGSDRGVNYLLSKKSSNPYSSVRSVQIDDEDVTEIARYNLQGIPVNANEKGVQIIVYSNYTTKTVIVQ